MNNINKKERLEILKLIDSDFEILRGHPLPLGAAMVRDGINFAVFSSHSESVSLVIFPQDSDEPLFEIPLDERYNRTGNIWHAFVSGLDAGIRYGYRIECSKEYIGQDVNCNNQIVLLDPYTKAATGGADWDNPFKILRGGKKRTFRLSMIIDDIYDWELDQPLNIPLKDTIIYELHVRGFTRHPSSKTQARGTFKGLIDKIPYLKKLGITAVELMPVTDFDETGNPRIDPKTGKKLHNFWGYDPIGFFAVKAAYAQNNRDGGQVYEFKDMVKAFHKAGIEVILDMVFNHTSEGNEKGDIYNFKCLDKSVYYLLDAQTGDYLNYSGCGNTLNCNHPVVRDMILDSLRYWVMEMHIDGFRFDLASILGRGRDGSVLSNPPLIERIAEDPVLAKTKLIAEAWDAAGLYQVGDFPHWQRWMEWNGKFRDDIRKFIKGDPGMVSKLAMRLSGSSDLYQDDGREPFHSVNFVTCHDGFTLNDLVSYNNKHNLANGEDNLDGSNNCISWNCGEEGDTASEAVKTLRQRQMRNFAAALLLSQGVPMILAGDEFGRTQKGNNNAYCQDNEISWVDWNLAEKNAALLRFFQILIQFRKNHPNLRRTRFEVKTIDGAPEMNWHGFKLNQPDWSYDSRSLAVHYAANKENKDTDIFIIFNAHWEERRFELPKLFSSKTWRRVMDTTLPPPHDIVEEGKEAALDMQDYYPAGARSAVLLIGK
jgi:glycogen operon protein